MLTINATFIVIFFSFILFMLLMNAVFFQPVQTILANRELQKQTDHDEALAAEQTKLALQDQYDTELSRARKQGQRTIADLRQQAKQEADMLLTKARESAQAQIEQKLQELKQWQTQAYQSLAADRAAMAELIVQKMLKQVPDTVTQS